jgi:carbon-monoxide dehydrogenase medium subunit
MKAFTFIEASTLSDAVDSLAQHGSSAKVIAGGQSLLLAMKNRTQTPEVLISVRKVQGMSGVSYDDAGNLVVGATTTYFELENETFRPGPHQLLSQCAADLADIPVRHMGTVGGALCQAGHRFDFPALALALDGVLTLHSSSGERQVPVSDFIVGDQQTTIRPDEVLTTIAFKANDANAWAFEKFRYRKFDAAMVSVTCHMTIEDGGKVRAPTIVVGAAGAKPVRATAAESVVDGSVLTDDAAAAAAQEAMSEVEPIDYVPFGSRAYKSELVRSLVKRALVQARVKAGV